jgi:hypothetical protein
VIVNGRIVYGKPGWITAQYPGSCAICGDVCDEGAKVIRVWAKSSGGNWAAECCARDAVILSGLPAASAPRRARGMRPRSVGRELAAMTLLSTAVAAAFVCVAAGGRL